MNNLSKTAFATAMSALTLGGIATKANATDLPPPAPFPYYKAPAPVVYDNEAIPEAIYGAIVGGVYGDLFKKEVTNNTSITRKFIYDCGCTEYDAAFYTNTTKSSADWRIALKAGAGAVIGFLDGTVGRDWLGDSIPGLAGRGFITAAESAALSFLDKHTTNNTSIADVYTECGCGQFKLTGQTFANTSKKTYNYGEFASAFAFGFAMPWIGNDAKELFVEPAPVGYGGYIGYRREFAPSVQ